MLNLILGKPKLDFYLEIALAHLPQLEFKVCEIAPQAGFLRFWQAKKTIFLRQIRLMASGTTIIQAHLTEPLTDPHYIIIQVDRGA